MRIFPRTLVTAALAAALSLFGTTAAAEVKVAVVDVQRAVMQTEDGLRAQATLKKLFDSRQQELNKRQVDLQKQKEDIDKQAKVMSQQSLQKKQKELTDPIFERVLGAIKRIAGQDSYDLIVDRATVAFSRSDLDLTDKVIQVANGTPAGGGPAAPGSGHATPPKAPAGGGAAKP
jgi:outer membrane protein